MAAIAQKYALVTGANRGIGLDVTRKLLALGKPVILAARDPEAGSAAAKEVSSSGAKVVFLQLDTSKPESIKAAAAEVAKSYNQQIDLLVNNAGVLYGSGIWDVAHWSTTMATNVKGPIDLTQALLPHLAPGALVIMVSSGLGKLGNISSDYADAIKSADTFQQIKSISDDFKPHSPMSGPGAPGQGSSAPTYCASKALLNRSVQLFSADPELKSKGVNVAATCPGWCRTRMGTDAANRSSEQGADSVLWPFTHWDTKLAGSFTRDGETMEW